MAETWLNNGAHVQVDGNNITFSHGVDVSSGVTVGNTLGVTGAVTCSSGVDVTHTLECGIGVEVDTINTATDTVGITWYYGDGASAQDGSFYIDCYHDGTRECLRVVKGATQCGKIYDNSGWQAGCSREYKEDIRDITPEELKTFLASLENDEPKKYKRIGSDHGDEVGVIAEEANNFINGDNDEWIAPIRYCGYLHTVIKAMQVDFNEKIADLQAQIDELKQ